MTFYSLGVAIIITGYVVEYFYMIYVQKRIYGRCDQEGTFMYLAKQSVLASLAFSLVVVVINLCRYII